MISMKDIQKVSCGRPGRKVTYIRSSADDRILSGSVLFPKENSYKHENELLASTKAANLSGKSASLE
jgi:hypothetical protein